MKEGISPVLFSADDYCGQTVAHLSTFMSKQWREVNIFQSRDINRRPTHFMLDRFYSKICWSRGHFCQNE